MTDRKLTPEREAEIRMYLHGYESLRDSVSYIDMAADLLAALDEARQQIERLARERDAAQEIISELGRRVVIKPQREQE